MSRQMNKPYNFRISDQEVLERLEAAKACWPEGESSDTFDWGQYIGKHYSHKTIMQYGDIRRLFADYLEGKGLGSVDRFLDASQPVPSLDFLKRIIRSKAKRPTGVISTLMTAHSLAAFVSRLVGAIGWYVKKPVPSNYHKVLTDYVYQDLTKELKLSYTTLDKHTATSEEFSRFLKKSMEVPLVNMFPSLRDALSYLLYINLYVDTGARGSDLVHLKYEDCEFYLAPKGELHSILAVVSLTHIKSRYEDQAKKIPLHFMELNNSYNDSCRLLFLAALGEQIFYDFDSWNELNSVVRTTQPVLLPLRKDKRNTPVFSHIKHSGLRVSDKKLVPRTAYYYGRYTSQLAKAMGLSRRVTLYSFRRMGIQALATNEKVTRAQRQQFSAHASSNIYESAYAPRISEADIQARIRGYPARSESIHIFNGIEAQQLNRDSQTVHEDLGPHIAQGKQEKGETESFAEESDEDSVTDSTDTDLDSDTADDELYDDNNNNDDDDKMASVAELSSNRRNAVVDEDDFKTLHYYLTELPMEKESFMMTRCAGYLKRDELD